jgi:hypothetical protein
VETIRLRGCIYTNGTAFPALAVSEANPNSSLRVRFQKALVSIEAKEVSWVQLLEDLSRKSGIVFHTRTSIEGPVTVSFRNLPLDRALQHLFGRDANFMFVYGNPHSKISSAGLPAEVWIFGGGQRAISQTFGLQDAEPALEDANDPAQEMLKEFERNPQAARDAARRRRLRRDARAVDAQRSSI